MFDVHYRRFCKYYSVVYLYISSVNRPAAVIYRECLVTKIDCSATLLQIVSFIHTIPTISDEIVRSSRVVVTKRTTLLKRETGVKQCSMFENFIWKYRK